MHPRLLACLLAACGSNGTKPDAAPAPDAHPDASIDAPPPMISGLVTIARLHDPAGLNPISNATAQFVANSSIYGTTLGSDGGCTMLQDPPTRGISAGTIVIDAPKTGVILTPSGSPTRYSSSTVAPSPFAPGDPVHFGAAGAEVPPVASDVAAPAVLAGFTPPATISRAAGFQATWTAGAGQRMWLLIVAQAGSNAFVLLCRVPDSGSFMVTPAALAMFPTGTTSVVVTLTRAGEGHVNLPNGGEIDFEAFDGVLGTNMTLTP